MQEGEPIIGIHHREYACLPLDGLLEHRNGLSNDPETVYDDGTAYAVAPELNELLDGEDTSQIFNAPAPLVMSSLYVGCYISGDPRWATRITLELRLASICSAPSFRRCRPVFIGYDHAETEKGF
jgi:hypothetical protein